MSRSMLDLWVGFFVAIGIAAILFLALKVGNLVSFGATPGYRLEAAFDNIGGLKLRAPVKAAGVAVGRVERIRFDPKTYQAVVTMKIDEGNKFTADTIASVLTSGLLGEVYVGLDVGGDTKMLDDGARIGKTQSAVVLEKLIGQFLFDKAAAGARQMRALARMAAVAAVALVAGCASTPSNVDPLEPMNRALYQVHDVLDTNIVKPVAEGYVSVVPQFVRTGFANVFNNIDDLFSAVNGLLQGKPDKAGNDLGRVMINTMFGLGGLIDVAADLNIERGNEDFGQTFAVWGFPQGPYLFIPLFGPTTVRDGTGVIVRIALGPVGYVPNVPVRNSIYGVGYVDLRSQALESGSLVDTAALDRYIFIRNAYLQRRRYLIYDGKPPPEPEDDK